jgi:hypothetical protein
MLTLLSLDLQVLYTDAPASSTNIPLSDWDLFGVGIGPQHASIPNLGSFWDARVVAEALNYPSAVQTAEEIDSFVLFGQRRVSEESTPHMPYPCENYGTWTNGFEEGWFIPNISEAVAWELSFVPSVGACVREGRWWWWWWWWWGPIVAFTCRPRHFPTLMQASGFAPLLLGRRHPSHR